jgi:hypothetical protein
MQSEQHEKTFDVSTLGLKAQSEAPSFKQRGMKMTTQSCNIDKAQAELIWRGLWREIDQIEADLDNRSITEKHGL